MSAYPESDNKCSDKARAVNELQTHSVSELTCSVSDKDRRILTSALSHELVRARFWAKVRITERGCWEWTGAHNSDGYGQLRFPSTECRSTYQAHRLSWMFHRGPIPIGVYVCHRCDNPPCIRPDHLFLGTNHQNQLDALSKARRPVRLTSEQVAIIREKFAAGGVFHRELAKEYGVTRCSITKAINGSTHRHVRRVSR